MQGLATDPFDNLVAFGSCEGLSFGDTTFMPTRDGGPPGCVVKLRPNGAPLWAHMLEGGMVMTAITADATGHVWVAGYFARQAWSGDQPITGNDTNAGLVLRLSP